MFDFDASKLLIIGIVALVFIPSKDLPRVLRQIGQFVGKMRRMASEFQGQFMDAMREADMAELRREAEALAKAADVNMAFNPIQDVTTHLSGALDGKTALDADTAATLGAASDAAAEADPGAPSDLVSHGDADASFADLSHPAIIVTERQANMETPHHAASAETAIAGSIHETGPAHETAPLHDAPPLQASESGHVTPLVHESEAAHDAEAEHGGTLETLPRSA